MFIRQLLQEKNMSVYNLSKNSGIPYTTVSDIITGKAKLEKCSAQTVYLLSKSLDVSMEALLESCFTERTSFELFKSNVCHRLNKTGDINFIIETLEKDEIRKFYNCRWFPECFYLLAMLDYISRINSIPLCEEYNDLRTQKLKQPLYPSGIVASSLVSDITSEKERALKEAIPEFLRHNIIEGEVRNVC